MDNNCNIPVQEPKSSDLKFISTSILIEHVIKHVIEAPEERWISVFSEKAELVSRVRKMYFESGPLINTAELFKTKSFKKLTSSYASLAAKTLAEQCSKGVCHVHQLEDVYSIESNTVKLISRYQKIQAFSEEHKVVIIATLKINQNQTSQTGSSQQEENKKETSDYVILTMYRPEKKLLKKQSFRSWFNDRIERGNPMHPNETLLADHR